MTAPALEKPRLNPRKFAYKIGAAIIVSTVLAFVFIHLREGYVKKAMIEADLNKRISLLTKAYEMGDKQALMLRAISYVEMQNYALAVEDLNEAIKKMPAYPVAYLYRGKAYVNSDLYLQAEQDLNRALELLPEYNETLAAGPFGETASKSIKQQIIFNQALALAGQKKYEQAIEAATDYISLEPTDHLGYYLRGQIYGYAEKPMLSAADLKKADSLKTMYKTQAPQPDISETAQPSAGKVKTE